MISTFSFTEDKTEAERPTNKQHPERRAVKVWQSISRNASFSSSWFVLVLTFSVDWAVPKKIGTKASQMMQVVYMVKPIGLASLNVSGTPRLFTAYTVHVT